MTYPASEMIANTISEAIKTADRMSGWDYFAIISSAIAALGTIGLLFWEMNKSYKERARVRSERARVRSERARVRSITTLQKIEKQHQKIISFLFKNDLPNNDRILWYKAYLELQKLHAIDSIETPEIREEAESDRSVFIEQLKSIEKSDPVKTSLRWQFFTGVSDWQTNNDAWKEIRGKANIGNSFAQADNFGNYDKKDGVQSLSPYHIIAVYHFLYTGITPKIDSIEFPSIKNELRNKKELIAKILIYGISPEWLHHSGYEGLIHYLFEFYTQTSDESVNNIHS
ncbi:hypothetical protein [Marinomonas arenicola]|uniref:Uncharacterized protein n=1 Tax=Marinomonas arenicola TaxID=569601 RepID=A0ABU9G1D8_9GAMM